MKRLAMILIGSALLLTAAHPAEAKSSTRAHYTQAAKVSHRAASAKIHVTVTHAKPKKIYVHAKRR